MSLKKISFAFVAFLIALPLASLSVLAEDLTEFSAPASGSDMWNGMMGRSGLYSPHANNCAGSTEVFVAVATAPDGVSLGFCIDKNQQAGTASWTAARHTCLASKKRLPEPAEFVYACINGVGINGLTDDWEWATNFSTNIVEDGVNVLEGVAATAIGNGNCTTAGTGWVANSANTPSSLGYRCVH